MDDGLRLVARASSQATQIAMLSGDGRLREFYREEASAESLVGAIFLGCVERVLPDIKAAFVRLGLSQNGFLPIRESDSFHQWMGDAPLKTGQELLVQVKKDPKGDKGAFLTRDIALPGQYALLMPNNHFLGTSRRMEEGAERERARALGSKLCGGRFGLIVRHAALFASMEEVENEINRLWERWEELRAGAKNRKPPALLSREPSMLEVLARDYAARHSMQVSANFAEPTEFPESISWNRLSNIELDALWQGQHIDSQLAKALQRRVELPGGGSLVIDEREAMQTIDVNSGRTVSASGAQELPFAQNLAAVEEIARQIRLRNLSGIILIDFIDMGTDEERVKLQEAMESAVRDDRAKAVVHGFTRLGILEMTRKRTRDSLRGSLTQPCKECKESGRIFRG